MGHLPSRPSLRIWFSTTSALGRSRNRPPLIPLFVIGFLGAALLRSSGILSGRLIAVGADLEKLTLTIALAGLGLGVRLRKLRVLGQQIAAPRGAGVDFGRWRGVRRNGHRRTSALRLRSSADSTAVPWSSLRRVIRCRSLPHSQSRRGTPASERIEVVRHLLTTDELSRRPPRRAPRCGRRPARYPNEQDATNRHRPQPMASHRLVRAAIDRTRRSRRRRRGAQSSDPISAIRVVRGRLVRPGAGWRVHS
jgi:hypothetical protein